MPEKDKKSPWTIPEGTPPSKCRGCNAEIFFVPYLRKKDKTPGRMPCDPDGVPHFASCPKANDFRKEKVNR
jgi:hypothetical protein